jgi:hypothetical protein
MRQDRSGAATGLPSATRTNQPPPADPNGKNELNEIKKDPGGCILSRARESRMEIPDYYDGVVPGASRTVRG